MRSAEYVAKAFHDAYEELAPKFGYETREESAVPWEEVPVNNRNLMIAVVKRLLGTCISCTIPDKYVKVFDPPIEIPEEGLVIDHEIGNREAQYWLYDQNDDEISWPEIFDSTADTIRFRPLREGAMLARVVVIG